LSAAFQFIFLGVKGWSASQRLLWTYFRALLERCWHVGTRDGASAKAFIDDLAPRMASRVQLTTDGYKAYLKPVDDAFGANVDYAMLVKLYGPAEGSAQERRYSPAKCCGSIKGTVCGNPNDAAISTSHVERQNLTMRMSMRRFTRLTNGFSKKLENHMHAVSLHFMFYNFCRIHKSLRVTPAMEAKIDDHVWTMEEVVMMADTNT
jgi:IS1 family transposase